MRSRIMFSILFVSLLIFSCEKEVNDSPFTIHIKSQIDIDELKNVTLRSKLNTLSFDVPEGSDLDLSFLKDVESIYSLVIKGNAVNLHQLESLSHIENFKIEKFNGSEIRLPALKTIDNMSLGVGDKVLNNLSISFPSLVSVTNYINMASYSEKYLIENLTMEMPSLESCERLVIRHFPTHVDLKLPNIKTLGTLRLSYATLKSTINNNLTINRLVELSAGDGIANYDWLKNSFGTTKSYKFFGIKPSNLCFMLPVAKTEPLRIVIQEDRDRYYGNKIVEECI